MLKFRTKKILNKENSKFGVQLFIFFILALLIQALFNVTTYYGDSQNYLALSYTFFTEDGFSLKNYPNSIRGVVYPLILVPFNLIAKVIFTGGSENIWSWRIFSSLLISLLVCIVPLFFEKEEQTNREIFGYRVVLFVLCWVFWRGLFLFPLSDAVALVSLLLGLVCVLYARKMKNRNVCIGLSTVGDAFYFTYNIRTIYLFPTVLFLMGFLIVASIENRRKHSYIIGAMIIGILIASIPQIIVNWNIHHLFSPLVITKTDRYPNGMFARALGKGLLYTEIEGYVGSEAVYPVPYWHFVDNAGHFLMQKENFDATNISIKDVIGLIIKYPFEIIGIYTRHFINMLNPVWGEIYVTNLNKIKIHLTLLNYFLLCLGGTYWAKVARMKKGKEIVKNEESRIKFLLYATILFPVITILPGAMEGREMFPAYILFYAFLLFGIRKDGIVRVMKIWKEKPIFYFILFFVIFSGLCAVWGNTYSNMEYDKWIMIR